MYNVKHGTYDTKYHNRTSIEIPLVDTIPCTGTIKIWSLTESIFDLTLFHNMNMQI